MRHPLHSICPYFAMFPEDFVTTQLYAYTRRGDTVFDPFSGAGNDGVREPSKRAPGCRSGRQPRGGVHFRRQGRPSHVGLSEQTPALS